jgi:tetratricopeptide (TPR) repeat protein
MPHINMKRFLTIFILLTISIQVNGQNSKGKIQNSKEQVNEISTLEKLKDVQHELDKQRISLNSLDENINLRIDALEERLEALIDKLDNKYENYLIFGGLLIALISFLINFLGRQLIKERVEILIQKTAFSYAQKTTNQVINEYIASGKIEEAIEKNGQPIIERIIKRIEKDGFTVIDDIKAKGDAVISSMLAKHSNVNVNQEGKTAEEQITEERRVTRANEFFDLALTSKDPLVQIELYKKVLEIEPKNPQALNNLGASYNNAYSYKNAISVLSRSIEIAPNFALPYANIANSYNQLGDLTKSLEYADKAMSIDPSVDYTYSVKGNVLTKLGKLKEAEEIFNKAIDLNGKSPEAYFARGYFYEETKQFKKSEFDYFKADSLGLQDKAMLYNNMAVLYRRQKNFDKAIQYLEKARGENPLYPNIDGTLSLIYADKKDRDNFYKYLVVALEKGCPAWNYLSDSGFDEYRNDDMLISLLDSYKKKYVA